MSKKILVIDIETTALRPQEGSITEIGIVELDLEDGSTRLLFDQTCHNKAHFMSVDHVKNSWIVKNGYMTLEEIRKSQDFRSIKKEVQDIINSYPNGVTAYNRIFDIGFLTYYGITFPKELPCPMLLCTNIVKAPHKNPKHKGYKWAKVQEAYDHFFPGNDYTEIHRGGDDAMHEAKIVYELYKMKIFKI